MFKNKFSMFELQSYQLHFIHTRHPKEFQTSKKTSRRADFNFVVIVTSHRWEARAPSLLCRHAARARLAMHGRRRPWICDVYDATKNAQQWRRHIFVAARVGARRRGVVFGEMDKFVPREFTVANGDMCARPALTYARRAESAAKSTETNELFRNCVFGETAAGGAEESVCERAESRSREGKKEFCDKEMRSGWTGNL